MEESNKILQQKSNLSMDSLKEKLKDSIPENLYSDFVMVSFPKEGMPTLMALPGSTLKILMCSIGYLMKTPFFLDWKLCIHNDKQFREFVRDRTDISDVSIHMAMSNLCKSGILERVLKGYYYINPEYVKLRLVEKPNPET